VWQPSSRDGPPGQIDLGRCIQRVSNHAAVILDSASSGQVLVGSSAPCGGARRIPRPHRGGRWGQLTAPLPVRDYVSLLVSCRCRWGNTAVQVARSRSPGQGTPRNSNVCCLWKLPRSSTSRHEALWKLAWMSHAHMPDIRLSQSVRDSAFRRHTLLMEERDGLAVATAVTVTPATTGFQGARSLRSCRLPQRIAARCHVSHDPAQGQRHTRHP
jgi:hypothetical protein